MTLNSISKFPTLSPKWDGSDILKLSCERVANLSLSNQSSPSQNHFHCFRYFSYILPQTFACEAMRGILLRGWGLTYMPVWRGFLVTIAWIVGTYAIFKRLVIKRWSRHESACQLDAFPQTKQSSQHVQSILYANEKKTMLSTSKYIFYLWPKPIF